ncbi:MAG: alpha/beta fold hydrolase [Sandaracinus sp.]|nr:alpha/beta fold hydrolase [Sandaracinus sp.]MCB9624006.1 alpha/beta fold hydrolase [Sandaracinus sp.]
MDWPAAEHVALGPFRVAYRDVGPREAPALLLIHGLGSSGLCWLHDVPTLARNFRVIVVDLPGCGESAKPRYAYSLAFWRGRLWRLLDHLALASATLIGHSMGAQLAIGMALESPKRVDALVLAAPAGIEHFSPARRAMLQRSVSLSWVRRQSQGDLRAHLGLAFHGWPHEAERLIELRRRLRGPELEGYAHAFVAGVRAMLDEPVHDRLGELRPPTLVVFGREDRLVPNRWLHPGLTPADLLRGAARTIPDVETALIPDAGHLVQFERPEAFDALVLDFLTRRLPREVVSSAIGA